MLRNNEFGYAVMSKDLKGSSLLDTDLETCKKYCYNGKVIVEQIPKICGFGISFNIYNFDKPIRFTKWYLNILWLHIFWNKEYTHINGKIVYKS
jgi:hypothetical protein